MASLSLGSSQEGKHGETGARPTHLDGSSHRPPGPIAEGSLALGWLLSTFHFSLWYVRFGHIAVSI